MDSECRLFEAAFQDHDWLKIDLIQPIHLEDLPDRTVRELCPSASISLSGPTFVSLYSGCQNNVPIRIDDN